ncbi:alpha/beta hydrolase [Nocardia neocaledoniensis]|uniref:alpha/beta fold hydrolase n=1 Tax=Nocardia neocaledoniensis TaxID=236511 RepID=UPI0033F0DF33
MRDPLNPGRQQLVRPDGTVLRGWSVGVGPTVLLLHAGGEQSRVWEPVAGGLVAAGRRCLAFDLRGHGGSGGSARSVTTCAADIAAMIRDEPPGCVVVGASLGGLAALAALVDAEVRARVAGLVLVDVVPTMDPVRVREFLSSAPDFGSYVEIVEDVLGRIPQLEQAAAALEVPVLLVRAGERTPVTEDYVDEFVRLVPQAAVHRIAGAGHLVARERPGELAEVIVGWLPRG